MVHSKPAFGVHRPGRGTWVRGLVTAAASCLLLAACSAATPRAVSHPVPAPAPESAPATVPADCQVGDTSPMLIIARGRGMVVTHPRLASWYYAAASRHPVRPEAFWPQRSDANLAIAAIQEALAGRGEVLDDYFLQPLGVHLLEGSGLRPGDHIYIRGICGGEGARWTAPPRTACGFDAFYSLAERRLVLLDGNAPPEPEPNPPPGVHFRPECVPPVAGRVLPVGHGTLVADAAHAAHISSRSLGVVGAFEPDLAVVYDVIAAVRREIATRPRHDDWPDRSSWSIDEYYLQIAGVVLHGAGLEGRFYYIGGACQTGFFWAFEGPMTFPADGGACFFDAYYSLADRAIVQFAYHGNA